MATDLLTKLKQKINYKLAGKFDLNTVKSLEFVPLCIQNSVFFVGISSNSDKEKISEYIKTVIPNKVDFIYLTQEDFTSLSDIMCQEFDTMNLNSQNSGSSKQSGTENLVVNNSESYLEVSDQNSSIEFLELDNNEQASKANEDNSDDASETNYSSDETKNDNYHSVISKIKAPNTKKLGEILIEEHLITKDQLDYALAESRAQKIPLGSMLINLHYVTLKDIKEALGAQLGFEYATDEQLSTRSTNETSILGEDFIRKNKVIPLSVTDKELVVGMVNPNDTKVINEIIYQTGFKPHVKLVTHVEFETFVEQNFNNDAEEADRYFKEIAQSEDFDSEGIDLFEKADKEIIESTGAVSNLANDIITKAIDRRASDIHIEPMTVGYRVRLRIDGSLEELIKIPAKIDNAIISRFKVLAKMNIAEHRRAQDGSFTLKYKNRAQDFRVNTLPVAGKEKMVIRVLAPQMDSKQAKADKIEIVGASEDDIKKIKYMVSQPNGIVLTSGPTGSGKTTTLYSVLRYLNSDDVNITTIEDPIEIKLEGINQSPVNTKAGITFANSLRAILRQDPDTILIGEIRDFETLEVAISAALTGHLVLSTIHTNSAAATITRLIEMGAKDYLISSTVAGIMAQRLVKKLCPNCKEEFYPTIEEAKMILTDPEEIEKLTKTKLYRPKGCPSCKFTGYQGRLAVLEVMVINNQIRKLIAQHAHDIELEEFAVSQGMKTLKMSCLRHILEGQTSIQEQVRILGLASEQ